jgi:hypothetical protein
MRCQLFFVNIFVPKFFQHLQNVYNIFSKVGTTTSRMFGWLVADGWCWFVLREEYCWLVAGGWFDVREKYC